LAVLLYDGLDITNSRRSFSSLLERDGDVMPSAAVMSVDNLGATIDAWTDNRNGAVFVVDEFSACYLTNTAPFLLSVHASMVAPRLSTLITAAEGITSPSRSSRLEKLRLELVMSRPSYNNTAKRSDSRRPPPWVLRKARPSQPRSSAQT
jgi:hypothetical protein